jgi:hypothetical protein
VRRRFHFGFAVRPRAAAGARVVRRRRAWLFDKNGAEATAFELVAVGSFPLANRIAVLGKLGFANAYIEAPILDTERIELTYGIGLQYDMTPKIGLRGQWQRYDTEEEIDLFSVGLAWRF